MALELIEAATLLRITQDLQKCRQLILLHAMLQYQEFLGPGENYLFRVGGFLFRTLLGMGRNCIETAKDHKQGMLTLPGFLESLRQWGNLLTDLGVSQN